ncbi:MAG TPA: hypothetical protein VFF49_09550 [Thermodesulfobacteriota bacterium]|nr:hypothetical protein [Thermodesulfobacteriota bacterium]
MAITVTPFTIDTSCDCKTPLIGHEKEKHIKRNQLLITYLGTYLDGKYISYTYGKEPDEKTKVCERCIKDRF